MEGVVEVQRKLHEEIERVEDAIVKEMLLKKANTREQINSEQRMRGLCDRSLASDQRLHELYEDRDGLRSEEVYALGGPDEFSEFYKRLKSIRDFHHRHPNEIEEPMAMEFMVLDQQRKTPPEELQNLVDFSGEESYGKFLDLHHLHDVFINLKQVVDKIDYMSYLTTFDRLFEINKDKKNNEFKKYVEELLEYLSGYLERVHPLTDQQTLQDEVKKEFEERWATGNFPGWRRDLGSSAMAKHSGAHLDLGGFSSPEELMSLGLNRLKSALTALGLKCGGTLEERALRLFQTKGVPRDQLDPSLFAKNKGPDSRDDKKAKEIAFLEAQVYKYAELLGEQRHATRENVERRLGRTPSELRAENSDESDLSEPDNDVSDDDEETVPYNPKNLPLGWDGKPIPYWLFKLHGLNLTYSCEICGNAVYKGPKNFQRHFSEWRHAHGMRCLGIPNTAHFANVTAIADAMALWEKIKDFKSRERWMADQEEEFEDTLGNVVNKKTYEDLRRQGLL